MFTYQQLVQDYIDIEYKKGQNYHTLRLYFKYNLFCTNFGECIKINLN